MSFLLELNKKIKNKNRWYWFVREYYVIVRSHISRLTDRRSKNHKKRVLFYHIDSLGFAGTEKFLQILAKHIDKKKYDVFFLYPGAADKNPVQLNRLTYIKDGGVIGLPFDFQRVDTVPPHFVHGMNPDISTLISALDIDLLVTAGAGHADYPFSIIKDTPIILLNIFGQPNVQKNIKFNVCISREVAQKLIPIVPNDKIKVFPVPSEGPFSTSAASGKELRTRLGIKESDVVFGRIGRADNGIYDPIGIEAFKKALEKRKDIHYVIMATPLVLEKKVKDEKIPNVHFMAPSSSEEDVWAFHAAIDALAHFRHDGESFGLNIVESMLSGKPIISHKSHIWNAHLEYLDASFARVVEKDDVEAYSIAMLEYAVKRQNGELALMGKKALEKARKLFLVENNIGVFEDLMEQSLDHSDGEK